MAAAMVSSAAAIAKAIDPKAHRCGQWFRCSCPVHGSRGATLAISDGRYGPIVKCFAGCDANAIYAELRRLGLLDGRYDQTPRAHDDRNDADKLRRIAEGIWHTAKEVRLATR
jgi:hypothetical protein